MDKNKKLSIEWVDSLTQCGWTSEAAARDCSLSMVTTIGILVYEDDAQVVIANSYSPDTGEFASPIHIPKRCIKKRSPIK